MIERLHDEIAEKEERHTEALATQERAFQTTASMLAGLRVASPPTAQDASLPVAQPAPLLSEAIEAFIRAKTAKGAWNEGTVSANRATFGLLLEHLGDAPITQIDSDAMIGFLDLLKRLPSNLTKLRAKEGRTLQQMADLGLPPMAPRTAGEQMSRVSSMFKWCCKNARFPITYNPAEEFAAGKKVATYERRPFTPDELRRLFSTEGFASRTFENPYEYWLMLLGQYTGARLGELCQLNLVDFVRVEGVECIEITDDHPEQTLKNSNAKRLVPVHSELISLGLLRFVERQRKAGASRLFPELRLAPTTSHEASKWFGRFRRRAGLTEKQTTVFHSFRHGFITTLLDDGVSEHQVAPIVGHEAKLITGKVYWNKKDARKRQPIVETFMLPADVRALIPPVEEVRFRS